MRNKETACPYETALPILRNQTVKSVTLDASANRLTIVFLGDLEISCPADVVRINVPSNFFEEVVTDPA